MPKEDIFRVACKMFKAGFVLPGVTRFEDIAYLTKDGLIYAVNNYEHPHTIFGNTMISVDKEADHFRWAVKDRHGRLLVYVDWTLVYEWQQLTPDLHAALEASMVLAPLTAMDQTRLEARRPGITSMPRFEIDEEAWEVEDEPEPVPAAPAAPAAPAPKAVPPQERRTLSPNRKIQL